jgi:hypothetical protein
VSFSLLPGQLGRVSPIGFFGHANLGFYLELNTNLEAHKILHPLTKIEDFSVYEQMDTEFLLTTVLLPILRNMP